MKKHIKRVPTVEMSREDWLLERKKSLGGSDMGAVLGLNPYASPYSVWAEKTGRSDDAGDNEAMRIGRDLEEYVAKRFTEASGLRVQRCNAILRNEHLPFVHANVDRIDPSEQFGLECKTASALNASKFQGGEFPASYYAQCVTYLAVTEFPRWYLAALVMGREFHIYQMTRIETDHCPDWCDGSVYVPDAEISALYGAGRKFWESYILPDVAPPVDGKTATTEALAQVIGDSEERAQADLTAVQSTIRRYLALKDEISGKNEELERCANEIKQFMGTAGCGVCELAKISYKTQQRRSFDVRSFSAAHPHIDLSGFYKTSTSRPFKVTDERSKL